MEIFKPDIIAGLMGPIGPVIAVVIEGMALFGFLFAFRFASQSVGKLHEIISNRGNQFKEMVKGNAQDPNSLRNKAKRNVGHQIARSQADIMAAGKKKPNEAMPSRFRRMRAGLVGGGMFGNVEGRLAHYQDIANKNKDQLTSNSLDDLIYAGGGYTRNGKYYNSKGEEIAGWEYRRGKSLYGNNLNAVGTALGYRLYKSQTDEDIAQLRESFKYNAMNNNWSDEEASRVWAAATYPYKTQMGSEWYSAPKLQRQGGNGRSGGRVTGVDFQDISKVPDSYSGFIEEFHKTRSSFRLSDVRDGDWRAMAQHQSDIQRRLDNGEAVSQTDLDNYAKTSEVLDSVATQGRAGGALTFSEDGEVQTGGLTPASKGAVEAMYSDQNRRYGVTHMRTKTGERSENQRVIYRREPLLTAQEANIKTTGRGLDDATKFKHIEDNTVGTATVTGNAARSVVQKV